MTMLYGEKSANVQLFDVTTQGNTIIHTLG